ncbi:hypothetical protein LZ198_42210 [Myxococcus sp. K15C18031901]|nr:hypothetical protein [Myxococcus dinghuensis]
MLRALLARTEWPRADVERLAAEHGLLPDGALELINDAACDACGEVLLEEGAETLYLNDLAAREMVS